MYWYQFLTISTSSIPLSAILRRIQWSCLSRCWEDTGSSEGSGSWGSLSTPVSPGSSRVGPMGSSICSRTSRGHSVRCYCDIDMYRTQNSTAIDMILQYLLLCFLCKFQCIADIKVPGLQWLGLLSLHYNQSIINEIPNLKAVACFCDEVSLFMRRNSDDSDPHQPNHKIATMVHMMWPSKED
jgi:hypothetical protein